MPSVSTFDTPEAPGDGGGVCSAPRMVLLVGSVLITGSALMRITVVRGGLMFPSGGLCEQRAFLTGGSSESFDGIGNNCDCALALLGTCMPSSDRERLFRRVLYGMIGRDVAVC